jgi:hypothetical protein
VLARLSEAEALRAVKYKGPISLSMMTSTFLLALLPGLRGLGRGLARRPRLRRNFGRNDDFYARLATQYVERISAGSTTPVKNIAEQRRDSVAHIRDLARLEQVRLPRNIVGHMNWLTVADRKRIDVMHADIQALLNHLVTTRKLTTQIP